MKFLKVLTLVAVAATLTMTSCKDGGDTTAAAPASVTPQSTTTPAHRRCGINSASWSSYIFSF